jgi:hypothetical protein
MACTSEKQRSTREFCQAMNLRFPTLNSSPEKIARDTRNSQRRIELQYQQDLKRISKELF